MTTMKFGEPKPETYTVEVTGESPSALYAAMLDEHDTRPDRSRDGMEYNNPQWALPIVNVRAESLKSLIVTVIAPDAATAARRARKAVEAAAKHIQPAR